MLKNSTFNYSLFLLYRRGSATQIMLSFEVLLNRYVGFKNIIHILIIENLNFSLYFLNYRAGTDFKDGRGFCSPQGIVDSLLTRILKCSQFLKGTVLNKDCVCVCVHIHIIHTHVHVFKCHFLFVKH